VVLVHGSMDRSAGMARTAARLVGLHVVRYDRRGYGRSVHAGPPAGIDGHVDDLFGVIADHAGPGRRSVVVGHSYGAVVALTAASRRPDLVVAVGAFEPPLPWLAWWPATTAGAAAIAQADDGRGDPGDAADAFLRRMLGDERWEGLPEATRRDRRREGPALVAELASLRAGPPVRPRPAPRPRRRRVRHPVGRPPAPGGRAARRSDRGSTRVVDGAHHGPT
jgi:pimeloyl-ACP methyl ester carboxylesterase